MVHWGNTVATVLALAVDALQMYLRRPRTKVVCFFAHPALKELGQRRRTLRAKARQTLRKRSESEMPWIMWFVRSWHLESPDSHF